MSTHTQDTDRSDSLWQASITWGNDISERRPCTNLNDARMLCQLFDWTAVEAVDAELGIFNIVIDGGTEYSLEHGQGYVHELRPLGKGQVCIEIEMP